MPGITKLTPFRISPSLPVDVELAVLTVAVLGISFAYSSVGLGGGSSYTALFAVFGLAYQVIPTASLSLNTIVSLTASIQFARSGHLKFSILWPFLITSVPMAFFGGRLQLSEAVFQILLLVTLAAVAARIYFWKEPVPRHRGSRAFKLGMSLAIGSILGFIAGAVGIGGGIYLVPLILILGIGKTKEAAATGAVFILINSVTGLWARANAYDVPLDLIFPMALAVLVGGVLGSRLGAGRWEARRLQKILGAIILVAIVMLMRKLII